MPQDNVPLRDKTMQIPPKSLQPLVLHRDIDTILVHIALPPLPLLICAFDNTHNNCFISSNFSFASIVLKYIFNIVKS